MADKRMFSKQIIDSDEFLEMPLSTQALYFHLSMRADDDGFINNAKRICKLINASEDDLKVLIMKRFVLLFESGVIVIKHWRLNNYIRSDRYKETVYLDEKNKLTIKSNNVYTLKDDIDSLENNDKNIGIPMVDQRYTQIRIDKSSIDKNSIDKNLFYDFESEFKRTLSPLEYETIINFQKESSDDLIRLALSEAVKNNARSFKYIEAILRNWNGAGIKTKDEAIQEIQRFQSKRSNNSSNVYDKNLPQWYLDYKNGVEENYEEATPEQISEFQELLKRA